MTTGKATVATSTPSGVSQAITNGASEDHTNCTVTGPSWTVQMPCGSAWAKYGNFPGYTVTQS